MKVFSLTFPGDGFLLPLVTGMYDDDYGHLYDIYDVDRDLFCVLACLGSPASMTTITGTIGSFPSPGRRDLDLRNSISFGTFIAQP